MYSTEEAAANDRNDFIDNQSTIVDSNQSSEVNLTSTINQTSYCCPKTGEVAKSEANLLANLIGRSGLTDCDVDRQSNDNNLRTFDIWMDMDEINLDLENQNNQNEISSSSESLSPSKETNNLTNQIDLNANCSTNYLDKVKSEMNINLRDNCAEINNSGDDLLSLVDS